MLNGQYLVTFGVFFLFMMTELDMDPRPPFVHPFSGLWQRFLCVSPPPELSFHYRPMVNPLPGETGGAPTFLVCVQDATDSMVWRRTSHQVLGPADGFPAEARRRAG